MVSAITRIARATLSLSALLMATISVFAADEQQHHIGAAKLIVEDLAETQAFYETMFGMKELRRYDYAPEVFEETIMGFDNSEARLALFAPNPKAEAPLKKSQFPVVLIYTPEFDAVTKRIEAAGHALRRLPVGEAGTFRIAIVRDPSGNAVEIFSRPGGYEVGGSKLIVDSREKAEAFYQNIFGAESGQRYRAEGVYDEVLMQFGGGPFLALFEPKAEAPLPKSRFALVAIYTSAFDAVKQRIEAEGLGYRQVETQTPGLEIIIARDPAGNAIEIIRE